ncbi:MAG: nucleotidyltransferase domain-containing protein [Thermodesulfobacteriota bacterium]
MSSIKKNPHGGFLVKTSHQRVLAFFLARPTGRFYGSEIADKTGISIGQASKVLGDLKKAGLVEMERRGRTELYRIVSDDPALRAFKVLNTIISIEPLVERLKRATKRVVLYGSCATGTNIEGSDLDLLVVSTKKGAVQEIISGFPADAYYGFSEIRTVVKTPAEWAALEDKDPVFHNELLRGISLYEKEIDESRL